MVGIPGVEEVHFDDLGDPFGAHVDVELEQELADLGRRELVVCASKGFELFRRILEEQQAVLLDLGGLRCLRLLRKARRLLEPLLARRAINPDFARPRGAAGGRLQDRRARAVIRRRCRVQLVGASELGLNFLQQQVQLRSVSQFLRHEVPGDVPIALQPLAPGPPGILGHQTELDDAILHGHKRAHHRERREDVSQPHLLR
mmetsp:Transcript_35611/g.70805  ORF Transcript_35611/g.70805 Transcript_35611/m.70805 type:complete len:202 (+) Transcript_35611:642-1247(+)